MAGFAILAGERRVLEFRQQLRDGGLMRIMAFQTIRGAKRLVVVRLLQFGIFRIMAVNAQRRSRLGQVKVVFDRRFWTGLMNRVASIAAHIESGVTRTSGRHVSALGMTGETEIVFLVP